MWEDEFPEVFANGGFDVVIGNPPYVDSESMTKNYEEERKYIAKNYKTAKGNWDLFIPFVELAFKLLKNNSYTSFIIPNKILSAKYARSLRSYVNNKYSLNEIVDVSKDSVFSVDVYPVILFFQNNKQSNRLKISNYFDSKIASSFIDYSKEENWALYLDENYKLYGKIINNFKVLKEHDNFKLFSAASVSEAYEIKQYIEDKQSIDNDYLKLINTGTIDPYINLWGISNMQYIKDSYKYPVINSKNIKMKEWTTKPKISFAGMVIRIEATLDKKGIFLPLKSTTVLTSIDIEYLKWICSILNSKFITFIFKIANSANTMAGGYLNVNQDNLGLLPIPIKDVKENDILSQKADLMLELNKNLQEAKQNFIQELDLEKVSKKLQNFEELEFEEFVKELVKAKKLKFADKLQERNFKQEWKSLFENDKTLASNLKTEISKTDKEIDAMVYELYELTDEEIKIVEGI